MEFSKRVKEYVDLIIKPINPKIFRSYLVDYLNNYRFTFTRQETEYINKHFINRIRFNFNQGYILSSKITEIAPDEIAYEYLLFAKYLKKLKLNEYIEEFQNWRPIIQNAVINGRHDGFLLNDAFEKSKLNIIIVVC